MLNSQHSISGLVLSYEFVLFIMFYLGYINKSTIQKFISPFLFINIFIVCNKITVSIDFINV